MEKIYMIQRLKEIKDKSCEGLNVSATHQSFRTIELIMKEWNDDIKKAFIEQLNQDYSDLLSKK